MNPQTLPAGPELDKLVAEAFPELPKCKCAHCSLLFYPSRVIGHAFTVLDSLRKRGWQCELRIPAILHTAKCSLGHPDIEDSFRAYVDDPNMPTGPATALAICRAALQAAEQEKQNAG